MRPHFWLTLFLVTLPLQIEQAVLHAVHYTELFEHPLVPAFLLNGLLGMVIGSVVGLVEVVLAYELIARTDDDAGGQGAALKRVRNWRASRISLDGPDVCSWRGASIAAPPPD